LKIAQESPEVNGPSLTSAANVLLNADAQDFISEMAGPNAIRDILGAYEKLIVLKGVLGFNLNKAVTWNYVSTIMQDLVQRRRTP
jgi:hypothetical protein